MDKVTNNYANKVSGSAAFSLKQLNTIYDAVFRESTNQPGYYFIDFGAIIDSETFRERMVSLKDGLSEICEFRSNKQLSPQVMGRFNHQHSSRFHRDTAVENSFLMLGYEPTRVDSKVYVADYTKYMECQNISLETYFKGDQEVNTVDNDQVLRPYISEVTPFPKSNYRLLLLNNSKSFEEKTFGVFHRAEVSQELKEEDRLLHYMMLNLREKRIGTAAEEKAILDFINSDKINR